MDVELQFRMPEGSWYYKDERDKNDERDAITTTSQG